MAENGQLKDQALTNVLWRCAERFGAQGVAFVVSIILANLLEPEVFGTVALLMVFTTILNVFVDSGLGNSLIQKKNVDDLDFSTVFLFNTGVCIVLYVLLYIFSPLIAKFYGDPQLTSLMRVLGLTLVISGAKNIQQAYVARNLMFKRFFFSTLGGTIIAALVGIYLAYNGYGAWALVAQHVVNNAIDTVILYITIKWRPHFKFSIERFKGLFSYGWKLLVSALIETLYTDVRQIIIGKYYTKSALAYYNQGSRYPFLIVNNITAAIDSVLLPVMSRAQDHTERVKVMTRKAIKICTYVTAPLMIGLAFTATPVVSILLGEKWLPCVPYMRIFCVSYAFYPIHTANLNAIKAMGRSDLFLKLEIVKKCLGVFTIIIAIFYGSMAMAYSMLISSILSQIINSWPNKRLMNYRYLEQLRDIMPNIFLSLIMGCATIPVGRLSGNPILVLSLQILVGALVYVIGSILFKNDSFFELLEMLKNRKRA